MSGAYGIVDSTGAVVEAPVFLRSCFNGVGGFHKLTDEQRKSSGWYPAVVTGQDYNPRTHYQNPPVCTFDAETETVAVEFQNIEKSIAQIQAEMLAELASYRYSREVGGLTVSGNEVRTDRDSQAMLIGAVVAFNEGFFASIQWKLDNGSWITIDQATCLAIAGAVAGHVQRCFNSEKTVSDTILATYNVAALAGIDIIASFEAAYAS